MAGYDNALAFGHDGSTLSHALKSYVPPSGVPHTMSVIVEMTDGLAPSWGAGGATGGTSPFAIVGNGQLPATGGAEYVVTLISGNTYRVAWTFIPSGSVGNNGVYKYAANNSRTFKVTGYKLELGSVATPYTPQSILRQRGTYQDTTGTMPLSAVAEVLGLMTDRLAVLGPNVFSDATSCTFAGESVRVSPGVYRVYSSAGVYSAVSVSGGLQQNKTYKLRFYQDNAVAGSLAIDGPAGAIISVIGGGIGWKEFIVTMTSVVSLTIKRASGATDIQISNVAIEELTGNHATQSTPANKPTLVRVPKRLGPNLLVNGDGNDTTGWTAVNGTLASVGGEFVLTASAGVSYPNFTRSVALQVGKSYRIGSRMRVGTSGNSVGMNIGPGFSPTFNAVVNSTTTMQPWSFITTATATTSAITAAVSAASASAGTSVFDDIEVCEVLEWTNAISFNGSSQFLNCGIVTGNGGWLCAGVTFGGTASTNETIFANGAGSATQRGVWLVRDGTSSGVNNSFRMGVGNGTALTMVTTTALPLIGTPRVVEGGWTASSVFVGVDGNIMTTARTGDATPAPQSSLIGCYAAGFHTMQGPMTAFVHCQTVPTEVERDIIRKWMASTNRAPYWGELPTLSLDFVSGDYLISNGEV